ncbi:hypothetical protein TSTA_062230 [Talaromyces stipitatus ATCC 10500]|uniref:F-box domain-containing protein n=1 Tax=Talaromyces stipitatus (strain ATCC 10500 / CBS 375.48 / QM 6759 / NRRL 1006) TaxID=441959 RepID=B8LX85_TALSN|nr:uncharacterized protein TSTA_062230 [Talaromyces stipitatus ATCC 10500]EED22735.1 hypothetical protein TSTA_062230 [Talaromyces stipitatus ATCC 10500]
MIDKLPSELLLAIFDLVIFFRVSDYDWNSISLVSRRFYQLIILLKYRTITFSSESEWSLNVLNTHRFMQSRSPSHIACHLGLVRNLRFVAPFRVAQFNRCSFRTVLWYSNSRGVSHEPDNEHFHTDFIWDLLDQLGDVFGNLKPGALSSFWWHLGTCLPSHVLDEDGYIPRFQYNIRDLSLRTDPHCPHAGLRLKGLRHLKKLRSLRWQQIVTSEELELVVGCLENNSRSLELIDLEFAPEIRSTPFMDTINNLADLHTLSLGNFRFTEFIKAAFTLSISRLRSLTLRSCPHQLVVLQILSQLNDPILLQHFEIALDEAHGIDTLSEAADHALYSFLESFHTLEHLHILVSNPRNMEKYFQAVKHHPSMKCFVYHTRSYVMDPRRSESTLHMPVYLLADLGLALSSGAIQNLGLCLSPITAKAVFQSFLPNLQIQVLHLRLSGSEYQLYNMRQALLSELGGQHAESRFDDAMGFPGTDLDWYEASPDLFEVQANSMAVSHLLSLANWAFGPNGIKTLNILAYGDFSCGDRYKKQQAILVRADPDAGPISMSTASKRRPYRIVLHHSDFFDKHVGAHETISACPLETLIDNSDNIWSL